MEIELNSSDVKLIIKSGSVVYEIKKPKIGQLKLVDRERSKPGGGDVFGAMETMLVSCGLPTEVFDNLEIEHLEQIMNAIEGMITPKKN